MSLHFSPFAPWDDRCHSGMRKEATVYIFMDLSVFYEENVPLFVSAAGAIMSHQRHGVMRMKSIVEWDQRVYRYVPIWSKELRSAVPIADEETLRQEGKTLEALPLLFRPDGVPVDAEVERAWPQGGVACPYCGCRMPDGMARCMACARDWHFPDPADVCAGNVRAGGGAGTGNVGASAQVAVGAVQAVAAPAVASAAPSSSAASSSAAPMAAPSATPQEPRNLAEAQLTRRASARIAEEAYAEVRRGNVLTDEIRKLRAERYGVTKTRTGFGKFMDFHKKNRRWQREACTQWAKCLEISQKRGIRELRGFRRTEEPWEPREDQMYRPGIPFTFTVDDCKYFVAGELLGDMTMDDLTDARPELKVRWDKAIEKVKELYEFQAQDIPEVIHFMAPARDFNALRTEAELRDWTGNELAALSLYELFQHSLRGFHPVFPWMTGYQG